MKKSQSPRPTDAELDILSVLWQRGPSTVREVHLHLSGRKEMVYTTVLNLLQIMSGKGLVERDERERAHRYRARVPQEQTQRQMLSHLLERAFEGSASKLVLQALSAKRTSAQELARIREMLDDFERGKK
ncbi:MAG: BlaI/MecI/CopY family transcriptional regulator [Pyrinomonadaceae bacterium]